MNTAHLRRRLTRPLGMGALPSQEGSGYAKPAAPAKSVAREGWDG